MYPILPKHNVMKASVQNKMVDDVNDNFWTFLECLVLHVILLLATSKEPQGGAYNSQYE